MSYDFSNRGTSPRRPCDECCEQIPLPFTLKHMVSRRQYNATWLYRRFDVASQLLLHYAKSTSEQLSNGCILKPKVMDEVIEIITNRYLATRRIITLRLHRNCLHITRELILTCQYHIICSH
jgi:hypothetical protein